MPALIDNGPAVRVGPAWPVAPPFPARVLNAVSGSPMSAHATAIATERNAELIVVHVLTPTAVRVSRLGPTLIRTRRLDDPFSSPVLLAARRAAWSHGVLAQIVLFDGETVGAILTAAQDMNAGLIVIGRAPPASANPEGADWTTTSAPGGLPGACGPGAFTVCASELSPGGGVSLGAGWC